MSSDSERDRYDDVISRRKMLTVAGASGMTALAGCGGDGDGSGDATDESTDGSGGSTDDGTEGGSQVNDVEYHNAYTGNPADLHFNTAGTQNYA